MQRMVSNGYDNGSSGASSNGSAYHEDVKPTYALEHLATFKVKNDAEARNPAEKMKILIELDKSGSIWPQKMYMCFNGQWLVMLDSDMQEIENFPGSMITEPTAFISEDPGEAFNNILVFTIPGVTLGNTEMHIFQVSDVSAVHMVEDLRLLSSGKAVTVDRNKSPIRLPKRERIPHLPKDQYGIAVAAAGVAAEKNAHDREQTAKDIQVLNHCFEDVERFVVRLQYAAEALHELESRQNEHNPHGEGLLLLRSRPPLASEFQDILAKQKLALNLIVKLQNHFNNNLEPLQNAFISLRTIVNVCNDVHVGENIPENVVNPLLRRETVTFLNSSLNAKDIEFWHSLGPNWTTPKDQFKDQTSSFHPIFYDDWSPDWVVDEEVPYLAPVIKPNNTATTSLPRPEKNALWLTRLQSRNVKIAEVAYSKTANTEKELNVTKGEYLEVIDDSRNWWKVRNSAGNIGYVPHTILTPHNFEQISNNLGRDTESITSSVPEQDVPNGIHQHSNNMNRNTLTPFVPAERRDSQQAAKAVMPRSYSMPNVPPVPPPMPPPTDSQPQTPSGTLTRNTVPVGAFSMMRARNDFDTNEETILLQGEINDEMKLILQQRERRRDLEILTTPNIYITQHSSPKEVEEWLRAKGFSDTIVKKLRVLNGEEIFALSPHIIEGYFGQRESRRLISQIVLQKNVCEYKTVRSSELSAKLAKARQKADKSTNDPNEVF